MQPTPVVVLQVNPGIGHWHEELADKRHLFFLVYSYLMVYRHETKPLQVIRVLHAARDVQEHRGPGTRRTVAEALTAT